LNNLYLKFKTFPRENTTMAGKSEKTISGKEGRNT